MTIQINDFNVKRFAGKSRIFSSFPLLLYINRSPTLPSLCEASHKDGWGESFEQREINVPEGELYVHFWSPENWSIETEEERFGPKLSEGVPETSFSNNNPKAWEGPEMGGMSMM